MPNRLSHLSTLPFWDHGSCFIAVFFSRNVFLEFSRSVSWQLIDEKYLFRAFWPGGADVGKLFEIMAVADPKKKLNVGDVLKDWPEAKAKSRVIDVTRK